MTSMLLVPVYASPGNGPKYDKYFSSLEIEEPRVPSEKLAGNFLKLVAEHILERFVPNRTHFHQDRSQ
ncbi:MAG: hypothetical protein ACERKS_10765, partial [Candidatus Bathyarchaeota archaeon]